MTLLRRIVYPDGIVDESNVERLLTESRGVHGPLISNDMNCLDTGSRSQGSGDKEKGQMTEKGYRYV